MASHMTMLHIAISDAAILAVRFLLCVVAEQCILQHLWLNNIHENIAKVSEEVNRKCPSRNTRVQLSTRTPTLSARIDFIMASQTDEQTDRQTDSIMPTADDTACHSITVSWLLVREYTYSLLAIGM